MHPFVVSKYERNELDEAIKKVASTKATENQTAAEKVLINLIADFNPLQSLAKEN